MMFREMNILIFLIILGSVEANDQQTNYSVCVDIEVDHPATFTVLIDEGSEIPMSKAPSTIPEDTHYPKNSITAKPAKSERKYTVKGISRTWAKPAFCIPELQVVSLLPKDPKPWMDYLPKCTRVKRCGGCCANRLSCQPTGTETIDLAYQVTNLEISKIPYWDNVTVEVHTSCSCLCKTKAQDCNAKQTYREDECACDCNNKNEEHYCRLMNDRKWWNSGTCTCHCREIEPCSEGLYFDTNSCRCEIKNGSTRNAYPLWYEPYMSPTTINGYNQMLRT